MAKADRRVKPWGKNPKWKGAPVPYGPKDSKANIRGSVMNSKR